VPSRFGRTKASFKKNKAKKNPRGRGQKRKKLTIPPPGGQHLPRTRGAMKRSGHAGKTGHVQQDAGRSPTVARHNSSLSEGGTFNGKGYGKGLSEERPISKANKCLKERKTTVSKKKKKSQSGPRSLKRRATGRPRLILTPTTSKT